jgi:phosphinothricin acetyltransferase
MVLDMDKTEIRPVKKRDWSEITRIFNHFVAESFAAYPDQPVEESFFRDLRAANRKFSFVVAEISGKVVGFAYLAPFHPASTMRRSATITYFLDPDHTGKGLGSVLLDHLLEEGRNRGIKNFMAHVSSLNEGSIQFHLKHGFVECGRFEAVGEKHGRSFDMVWLQRLMG